MPRMLRPDEWKPAGVPELEPAVDEAVRAKSNAVVIAGPGAGKTELLAQRACYLLQTDLCPAPRRILAISFKRDAARNLSDRVAKRCEPEHARRFDSMTYDAFAKNLVDRFGRALPARWRPSDDYTVDFSIEEDKAGDIVRSIPSRSGLTLAEVAGIAPQAFYRNQFVGMLPIEPEPTTVEERGSLALWGLYLRGRKPSTLNFEMIDRLAELLLRANPKIVAALRATYSFVFLDEFQDTTAIQYDLIRTAFHGSSAILTAVGDNKQRIMGFAYAVKKIFARYQEDFKAQLIRPVRNYRSAPELVRIQKFMADALDQKNEPAVAVDDGKDGEGECRVFVYANHVAESIHLAELIEKWIKTDGVDPRDICILVRKKPQNYTTSLIEELARRTIKSRVESEMQNLLSEPITTTLLDFFKLASARRAPESWATLMGLLEDIDGDDSEEGARDREHRLTGFVCYLYSSLKAAEKTEPAVLKLVDEIASFLNVQAFITLHPQYAQGNFFKNTVKSFAKHLAASRAEDEWPRAIEDFEGKGSVPIMTMHKSKGLEYHTVIFVGLEDSALHEFAKHQYDEACGFFVALSRAKKRAVFTFSENRSSRVQNRSEIQVLYDILERAGVKPERIA